MMKPSQDKDFVGQKILKLDRTLRFVKKRPLRNWRRSKWNATRKKTSTVHMQCHCTPAMHTRYTNFLRQINWLLSGTQIQFCYKFSSCASMAASPTIGGVGALNKLARQLNSQPVKLQFWPLTLGFLDAFYRNNQDGSSQRGMTVFLAELREQSSKDGTIYGSLTDFESQKI